ncbi:MAG: hypothetical protein SH818_11620, partial [Saprospiraceae bacterium]|nr:hypothetical protein [Saprospiraceae bacterium]
SGGCHLRAAVAVTCGQRRQSLAGSGGSHLRAAVAVTCGQRWLSLAGSPDKPYYTLSMSNG